LSALAASLRCRSVLKYQYSSQGELLNSGALGSQTDLSCPPRRIRPMAN
jgi:hypothetical protein